MAKIRCLKFFEKSLKKLLTKQKVFDTFHGGNRGSNPLGVTSVSLSEKMSLDDKKNPCYNVRVLYIWRVSQVVRHRSATPLSPVQIWYSPLKNLRNVPEIFFRTFFPYSRKIFMQTR